MSKRLYTGFSIFEFIWTLILRLFCAFGLVYSLAHYNENPVLIIIVSFLCLLFIFIIGDDQIIVYQDRITQTTNSFSSLFFKSKGKTFNIDEIKSAHLQTLPKSDSAEVVTAVLLAMALPNRNLNRDKTQPIFFKLKNGETVNFETNLEEKKMKKIVDIVNSLAK